MHNIHRRILFRVPLRLWISGVMLLSGMLVAAFAPQKPATPPVDGVWHGELMESSAISHSIPHPLSADIKVISGNMLSVITGGEQSLWHLPDTHLSGEQLRGLIAREHTVCLVEHSQTAGPSGQMREADLLVTSPFMRTQESVSPTLFWTDACSLSVADIKQPVATPFQGNAHE